MIRRFVLVSLALLCLLATGCGPTPEQRITGKWEGQFSISESAAAQHSDNPLLGVVQGMASTLRLHHEFRADKTYDADMPTLLGTVKSNGTWQVVANAGDTITVRLNPSNGASFERAVTFIDADHFETTDENGTLKFTRQPAN